MKSLGFRDFIARLDTCGELRNVAVEVDPDLEIAAITDRICKSRQNRALLFACVKGSSFRAATNLFGSQQRMSIALGIDRLADLTSWFDRILDNLHGVRSTEKLAALTAAPCWLAARPELCGPPHHLHEAAIDLNILPIIRNHPLDGHPVHEGRFLTLPLVITADRENGEVNCGIYRAAPVAPDRLVINWSSTSGAAMHAASWAEKGEPMHVVIALGCSPVLTFAAALPLPPALDEFTFAGLLQGEPLKTFSCSNGLTAPADAEIVMEGFLEPVGVDSGAFGNHTGFYTPSEHAASVKISSIKIRSDMILPATVVGRPPMEDCWIARAWGCLLLSLLKIDVPEVVALHSPFSGIFHGASFISVKNGGRTGLELIAAIRETGWFANCKLLVTVEADQDPADEAGVLWRIMNNVNWQEDMIIKNNSLSVNAAGRTAETRTAVESDAAVREKVESRWKEYGFE